MFRPIGRGVTYLAMCTPAPASERWPWILVPLAGALLYVLLFRLALRAGDPALRRRLIVLWVVTGLIGWIVAITPGGVSDPDADYLARFFTGMVIALGASALWTVATPLREAWRFGLMGLLGGATFMPWAVGLFIFYLSVSGTCFD